MLSHSPDGFADPVLGCHVLLVVLVVVAESRTQGIIRLHGPCTTGSSWTRSTCPWNSNGTSPLRNVAWRTMRGLMCDREDSKAKESPVVREIGRKRKGHSSTSMNEVGISHEEIPTA